MYLWVGRGRGKEVEVCTGKGFCRGEREEEGYSGVEVRVDDE